MISKDEARNLAIKNILQNWNIKNDKPVILDEYTIEKEYGWVFFYSSEKYEKTHNISDALAGNAPIIINKFDNSVNITGTAFEAEHYITEYEANLSP